MVHPAQNTTLRARWRTNISEGSRFMCMSSLVVFVLLYQAIPANSLQHTIHEIKASSNAGRYFFDPDMLLIQPFDVVTWIGNTGFPHNVVFRKVPVRKDMSALISRCDKRIFRERHT